MFVAALVFVVLSVGTYATTAVPVVVDCSGNDMGLYFFSEGKYDGTFHEVKYFSQGETVYIAGCSLSDEQHPSTIDAYVFTDRNWNKNDNTDLTIGGKVR